MRQMAFFVRCSPSVSICNTSNSKRKQHYCIRILPPDRLTCCVCVIGKNRFVSIHCLMVLFFSRLRYKSARIEANAWRSQSDCVFGCWFVGDIAWNQWFVLTIKCTLKIGPQLTNNWRAKRMTRSTTMMTIILLFWCVSAQVSCEANVQFTSKSKMRSCRIVSLVMCTE